MNKSQNKRTKQLIIRVSDNEYLQLQNKSTKPRLAEWMRETCLGIENQNKIQYLKIDPELLISLAKIGGNLNQIANT